MTTTSNRARMTPPRLGSQPIIRAENVALFAALIATFLPTLYTLLGKTDAALWNNEAHSHGPIMAAVATWLLHKRWTEFTAEQREKGRTRPDVSGWSAVFFAIGAFLYVAGRSLGIIYFEVGAFIPMLMGVITLIGGRPLLRALAFPIFFYVFMIPLPGFMIDPFSQFIKLKVSIATTEVLWLLGYPITHTGVIISIGQYQLLVADACAGMRTLFMLEAFGIFYINVVRYSSLLRNITLGLLIVPISFTANTIRVIFLALLTYHFGDEVGQGFLHGFAGIVLFVVALLLIISIDGLLRIVAKKTT